MGNGNVEVLGMNPQPVRRHRKPNVGAEPAVGFVEFRPTKQCPELPGQVSGKVDHRHDG